jgi:TonB family protein
MSRRPDLYLTAICSAITFVCVNHLSLAQIGDQSQPTTSPAPPAGVEKTPPRVDKNHPPIIAEQYPESKSLREHVRAEIDSDGVIRAAQIVSSSGIDWIDRACLSEELNWKFIPATVDGRPVVHWGYLPLDWSPVGQPKGKMGTQPDRSLIPQIQEDYQLKVGPNNYPLESRQLHQEGDCAVHVYVEADGTPRNTIIGKSTGFDLLDQACLWAVSQAVFVPAKQNGVAMAASTDIDIRWRLSAQ